MFFLGDISEIKTRSTESSLGFEEMINNVTITSSLYGNASLIDNSVKESELSELKTKKTKQMYLLRRYIQIAQVGMHQNMCFIKVRKQTVLY